MPSRAKQSSANGLPAGAVRPPPATHEFQAIPGYSRLHCRGPHPSTTNSVALKATDGARSAAMDADGVPLGWAAPWENPQMMGVQEKEGMFPLLRGLSAP